MGILCVDLASISGRPALSWHSRGWGRLAYASTSSPDGSGTWSSEYVATYYTNGTDNALCSVDGRPGLAYYHESPGPLLEVRFIVGQ